MISKQNKLFTFLEEPEMAEGGIGSKELPVKGGILSSFCKNRRSRNRWNRVADWMLWDRGAETFIEDNIRILG